MANQIDDEEDHVSTTAALGYEEVPAKIGLFTKLFHLWSELSTTYSGDPKTKSPKSRFI